MTRSVEEWRGKTDDTQIPPRVKIRIFEKHNRCCGCCSRTIVGKLLPRYDHIIALVNGGQNRESNIQLLCSECHDCKTAIDVKEKSVVYRKKAKHIGIKLRRGRPIPGSKNSEWKKTFNHGWVKR
jgi:5-methylcytosine-specific restriction enzyme A